MGNINLGGTFVLFFSNLLGKIFGAIYRLPLSNILGAEGMGLYQMAFPTYSFLLTFITGGISIGLTRKIAELRASEDYFSIYKNYKMGKNISFYFGLIFFVFLVLFAYPISFIQGNTSAFLGYLGIALGFIFACMLGAYRGYYQGFGNMIPTALSQVVEQSIKLVFGLVFAVIFGKINISWGVFGALLGVSVSEIISFLFFVILNKKHIKKFDCKIEKSEYKLFFKQTLPINISYMILPLSTLIDSFLVINLLKFSGLNLTLATSLYGIETGMILPLINVPNVLISAIALASIPQISYKLSKKQDISEDLSSIFKLVICFLLPCIFGMFILSKPILSIVFPTLSGEFLNLANLLLKFSVYEMFFLCFVTITNAILLATNNAKKVIKSLSFSVLFKIIIMIILILIPSINIFGLVLASTVCYMICSFINLSYIKKVNPFNIKILDGIIPLFACLVMALVIYLEMILFPNMTFINVCFIVLSAVITYFTILLAFGLIKLKEIKKLLHSSVK